MSSFVDSPAETAVPVFDVIVSLPDGVTISDVEYRALQVGKLSHAHIEGLVKALGNSPRVKVGDHIPKDRAELAKAEFSTLGLLVAVTPVLTIKAKPEGDFDARFLCRACDCKVKLPENRKCPNCGVFVDKITDEYLLKRKIGAQERDKLDMQVHRENQEMAKQSIKSMEDAIRAKIREELEEEYGIHNERGFFQGKAGLIRAGGIFGLLALSFIGGGLASPLFNFSKNSFAATSGSNHAKYDVERMLDNVGTKPPTLDVGAAGSGENAVVTGDADLDDPMIQSLTGGKKMGGKGLSLEQAIAASRTLAGSHGNTAFDRATGASASAGSAASATHEPVPVDVNEPAMVPIVSKQMMAAEVANTLAALGQWRRARALVKTTLPQAVDPDARMALQGADLHAQAWAMASLNGTGARQALDTLIADSRGIASPTERARSLGQVAVILSQHAQLHPDAAQAVLLLAAQSLESVPDAVQRSFAMGNWMASAGQVSLEEVRAHARMGLLAKAQTTAKKMASLIKEAPNDSSRVRLHAIDYQIRMLLGQTDLARQSLSAAQAIISKTPDLVERATLLRAMAQLAQEVSPESIQSAVESLRSDLDTNSPPHKEQAYAQVSYLYAELGEHDMATEYRRLAQATQGLTPVQSSAMLSELVVQGDLVTARMLHSAGRYAEFDALLQRLVGYLL